MSVPLFIRWKRIYHYGLAKFCRGYMVKCWDFVTVTEKTLVKIQAKLESADYWGSINEIHTVITLIFKPGETLTVKEEQRLLLLIAKRLRTQKQYVCCNRAWQDGSNFRAFLHVHDIPDRAAFHKLLIVGLNVR